MENVNEFDFNKLVELAENSNKIFSRYEENGSYYVYNLECGFDIETTSMTIQDNKVAFMYIWMFGIGEYVIYGRTWDDFVELCKALKDIFDLDSHNTITCYIHNFSFEFQFMRKYFEWSNVFAIDNRKPVKALTTLGIEFRDSYILSGMNLAKTAENLTKYKVKKLVGDLDYSKIRTYQTSMTKKELGYCENDVLVILSYIKEQIEMYGDITKIPLTNTGKVRKFVGDNCYYTSSNHRKSNTGKYKRYRELMETLTINDNEYRKLKRAFQGGFTHANSSHVGKILYNVGSYDFTSSYPSVMLAEKYPMSKGFELKIEDMDDFNKARKMYCLVFDVKFTNIVSKISFENYLSESKCYSIKNKIVNNGRIFSADELITTITDIDYSIIEQVYNWDEVEIQNVTAYYKNYLPKPIIESILELYSDKTTLKGVQGKEVEYLVSKGMINAVYGMCVTDIVRETNSYSDEWYTEETDVQEQLDKYNNNKKRFLYYPWGVFVTAYARRNLWSGILEFKDDYVYSDTDSVKALNVDNHQEYINRYNEVITKKFHRMCDEYSIDYELLKPKTIKGIEKPLGVWDFEGIYTRFKTLGAKRYLVEEDDELHLTVAGLSKKNGLNYMVNACGGNLTKVFELFDDDLYIPSDKTGKMTHTYIDEFKEFTILDYQNNESHIEVESGVHLENVEFTLNISKEYGEFLDKFRKGYIFKGVFAKL